MKVKIGNEFYSLSGTNVCNGLLKLDFIGKTAEEVATILSDSSRLGDLKVYQNDETTLVAEYIGYNQFSGVLLDNKVTGILIKESTLDEQRITALEAKTAANQTETTTNGAQATYTALMTDTILGSEETA